MNLNTELLDSCFDLVSFARGNSVFNITPLLKNVHLFPCP